MYGGLPIKTAYLVASGDLRLSANQVCWPAQEAMEKQLAAAFAREGVQIIRAHAYDPVEKHGFISSQRMGMDVFQAIPKDAAVIAATAVWQYSYHLLAGLRDQRGPILTAANWEGQWPGLVGMLNLNGSLSKMGVHYSTIWSQDFQDNFFVDAIRQWISTGNILHDASHVRSFDPAVLTAPDRDLAQSLTDNLLQKKVIMGIFDEGCMGMYNAIIEDELLNKIGIYKERLSQSALVTAMRNVTELEAQATWHWLDQRGMKFAMGADEATELTQRQVLEQLKMYIAAVRIAREFSCDLIGIQYQQGLKDIAPASDLAEGLLNNPDRPPVFDLDGMELFPGEALPHFNEVDEGAGVDALVTNRAWTALGLDPSTTLHDIRWGRPYEIDGKEQFVWVFEISGAVPASHLVGGYGGATSERQPPMYFPLGGGTLKGVSKPGEIVWSRVFVMDGSLQADLGRGTVVSLSEAEIEQRWSATTSQWPMMNAVLHGVSRDQLMARHKANHIQVAYAPDPDLADRALRVKAGIFSKLGIRTHLCGDVKA